MKKYPIVIILRFGKPPSSFGVQSFPVLLVSSLLSYEFDLGNHRTHFGKSNSIHISPVFQDKSILCLFELIIIVLKKSAYAHLIFSLFFQKKFLSPYCHVPDTLCDSSTQLYEYYLPLLLILQVQFALSLIFPSVFPDIKHP